MSKIEMTNKKNIDKRTAIIEAALKLFTENGFQETSTNSISKEAGVGTGTLFIYFSSKDELINKIYSEAKDEYGLYIQTNLESKKSFEDRIKNMWDNGVEWALKNPAKFKFMVQFSSSRFITTMIREEAKNNFSFLKMVFSEGLENNELIECDMQLIINLYLSHINTLILYFLNNPEKRSNTLSEKAFSILLNGLKK